MNIFEYYNIKNEDPLWVEEYQSTSDKKSGKTFLYTNTNFRTIFSFADVYNKFLEYNNLPREQWATYGNGEQMAKHWTVRMQQSKFFKKANGKYTCTEKGKAFGKLIEIVDNEGLQDDDFWILIYYFILNSYFGFKENYILKRSQDVYLGLHDAGYSTMEVNEAFESILTKKDSLTIDKLFEEDGFWMLSFYKDKDFMSIYKTSPSNIKQLLFSKVQRERKTTGSTDLIGHKFINSGQYNANMIIDDISVLYVTHELMSMENKDALILLDNICSIVERYGETDRKFLTKFLTENYPVFETIYNEAILNEDIDDEINEKDESDEEIEEEETSIDVDPTTTISKQLLRNTRAILKRMAKDRAGYKCELECLNSCKYFTSKEEGKNYLEIHHLIPWAFCNEFEKSLEHIDNYVALCPSCHMLLHHGSDRERKQALTYLYNLRKDKLKAAGLEITLEMLFNFYQVSE